MIGIIQIVHVGMNFNQAYDFMPACVWLQAYVACMGCTRFAPQTPWTARGTHGRAFLNVFPVLQKNHEHGQVFHKHSLSDVRPSTSASITTTCTRRFAGRRLKAPFTLCEQVGAVLSI